MKIKELLAKPEAWTQKAMARDSRGNSCGALTDDACQWCLLGAAIKCYGLSEYVSMWERIYERLPYPTAIGEWNDRTDTTHQQILDLVTEMDI